MKPYCKGQIKDHHAQSEERVKDDQNEKDTKNIIEIEEEAYRIYYNCKK